jgi:hypothetical protein
VPGSALGDVLAIAVGGSHSLALKNNSTVVAWGRNGYGQANVPSELTNAVAIAAGGAHSLALKANGTVVAWGCNISGQTAPVALNNVVAIAAGENHSLALLNTGEVVAWGLNTHGQTDVPPGAESGVVAIAALKNHSLALKANGTVVAWGENTYGQTSLPPGLGNVAALSPGWRHNVFLTAVSAPGSGGGGLEFVRADIPALIRTRYLREVDAHLVGQLGLAAAPTRDAAIDVSGAKALLEAVLQLGMPYTMERDDVLHGFFYGTEPLADLDAARALFSAETNRLFTTPGVRPMVLEEVVWPRFSCFTNRLANRLEDLQIPRLVGHTLRLLNLLRDAWAPTPTPALELGRESSGLSLVLYGDPYAHYSLEYRDNLSVPGWASTLITNLHNEQVIAPPVSSGPQRFYRGVLPAP